MLMAVRWLAWCSFARGLGRLSRAPPTKRGFRCVMSVPGTSLVNFRVWKYDFLALQVVQMQELHFLANYFENYFHASVICHLPF